jgi:hypothetical protein
MVKPETGSAKFWTGFHHLWFMPVLLWSLRRHGGVRPGSWTVSCAVTALLAAFCRATTPKNHHGTELNVNLAFEFWKDVRIRALHALDGAPAAVYLPWLVVVCNVVLNGPPYRLLRWASDRWLRRRGGDVPRAADRPPDAGTAAERAKQAQRKQAQRKQA